MASTAGATHSVKYRLSCDRCQNTKVRCSQDKPTCKRCAQRGVSCVYSPLRRIGRPRKVAGDDAILDEHGAESMISATTSPGDSSRVGYETSITSPSLHESGCQSDFAMADVQMMDTQVTASSQHPLLHLNGSQEPLRSAVDTWISDHQLSTAAQPHENQSHAASAANMRMAVFDGGANCASAPISAPSRAGEPHSGANCYATILTQTSKLVQALSQTALPPGIDLVLEAERDFCSLRNRLFTCSGHGLPPPQQQGNGDFSLQSTNSRDRPCLASDRPVLLSLALLAEHVIGMLEDMFRLAAQAAHTLDKTNSELSWSGSGPQDGVPGPSARRLQRSCRSFWTNPCVSPLVEASRDLRLGNFSVENPAKSKAMRRILTLRVGRMLQALQGMRRGRWRGDRDAKQVLEAPLDWGGSASVMSDVADILMDDLIRRVESLQGAMILIRNDSMI